MWQQQSLVNQGDVIFPHNGCNCIRNEVANVAEIYPQVQKCSLQAGGPVRHGEEQPAGQRGVAAGVRLQGCNSIDIFVGPLSGPEPGPSHIWSFETCPNL